MVQSKWKVLSRTFLSVCMLSSVAGLTARADNAQKPAVKPQPVAEAADVPNPKHDRKDPAEPDKNFVTRHEGFMAQKERLLKHGKMPQLVLVGDSITDGWHNGEGRDILEAWYGQYFPYNIGIGGDRTQHVLWRLDKGEVDGIAPKVAVLMIGTNNLGGNTNEEIAAGVTKIVNELKEKLPHTKVLLLAIFPRGMEASNPFGASRRSTRLSASSTMAAKP